MCGFKIESSYSYNMYNPETSICHHMLKADLFLFYFFSDYDFIWKTSVYRETSTAGNFNAGKVMNRSYIMCNLLRK